MRQKNSVAKPLLIHALRLVCLYCGQTPMRDEASWFTFRRGCRSCDYRFERELGYYTGASWMVTFPVVSVLAFVFAAALLLFLPNLNAIANAGIVSIVSLVLGVAFFPFGNSLWMYWEHRMHPLSDDDYFDKELVN